LGAATWAQPQAHHPGADVPPGAATGAMRMNPSFDLGRNYIAPYNVLDAK